MGDNYLFDDVEFSETSFVGEVSPDDLFSMLEALEDSPESALNPPWTPLEENHVSGHNHHDTANTRLISQKSTSSTDRATLDYSETELEATLHSPTSKRQKLSSGEAADQQSDGQNRMVHIRVERNRRKQMNEHLSVLRTLMPCFYVKRGDQASIVGGVVDYIKELQQVLHSLEAKKQRKVYSEVVLSPRVVSSPRPSPLSPRKPPLSPRVVAVSMPTSPRTPQPTSPYKPRMHVNNGFHSQTISTSYHDPPPSSLETLTELAANSKSSLAEVEVKYSGSNLLLRTVSLRIPGQALKIITALENHSLEILQVSISTVDDATILNSFTIKIGIECKLSADELAHEIQQTFC